MNQPAGPGGPRGGNNISRWASTERAKISGAIKPGVFPVTGCRAGCAGGGNVSIGYLIPRRPVGSPKHGCGKNRPAECLGGNIYYRRFLANNTDNIRMRGGAITRTAE